MVSSSPLGLRQGKCSAGGNQSICLPGCTPISFVHLSNDISRVINIMYIIVYLCVKMYNVEIWLVLGRILLDWLNKAAKAAIRFEL